MVVLALSQQSYYPHIRHTRLDRLMRILTVISQILCVAPILDAHVLHQQKLLLLRRLHLIFGFVILANIYAFSWSNVTNDASTSGIIENAFYFGERILNNFLSASIILGTFYHTFQYRNVPLKFQNLLKQINRLEAEQCTVPWNLLSVLFKELCYYTLGVVLLTTLYSCVNFFFVENGFYDLLRNVGSHILPNFLLSLKLGQYWLCLRFAFLLYKRLNEVLQQCINHLELTNSSKLQISSCMLASDMRYATEISWYKREYSHFRCDVSNDCELLEWVRRHYSDLDMLLVQVTNVFGVILLLNFLDSIFALSMYFFEIYKKFDCPELDLILWHIQHIARIFLILIANKAIVEEKCRTSIVLNELPITSRKMEHAINRFLLQLMARKASPTAYGIIELDLLLITGIASVISNFVMFLIQIDLSNISFEIVNNNQMAASNRSGFGC